jgi:DNA-binding MarR family transcriptional regulator
VALTDSPAFDVHVRRPPTGEPTELAQYRDQQLVHPSGVERPTIVALDLEGRIPSVADLDQLVVPLARAARAGSLGPLALVVCTSNPPTRDTLRALAQQFDLALFVAPSLERLTEAEPYGALTPTERETLDVMHRLGGTVTVAKFADATGLGPSAATNRLVSVQQKGFVQRVERPRAAGSIYLDPRDAIEAQVGVQPGLPYTLVRELEIFSAIRGCRPDELLAEAVAEYRVDHGEAPGPGLGGLEEAWSEYRARHSRQLSERLRWAQAVLADPRLAAVEMSGMSDEDLDRIRREFS